MPLQDVINLNEMKNFLENIGDKENITNFMENLGNELLVEITNNNPEALEAAEFVLENMTEATGLSVGMLFLLMTVFG